MSALGDFSAGVRFAQCHSGSHDWQAVYRHAGAASDAVVRWCRCCGCVSVDEDCDGRIYPGRYLTITASSLYRAAATDLNAMRPSESADGKETLREAIDAAMKGESR